MERMRERVARALHKVSFAPDDTYWQGFLPDADAALSLMQPEIDRRVAEKKANLESKFRCVISHATGGSFQDIDASLNEISVRISQFRTQLWEQAKQSGAKEEKAKLIERLRVPSEGMIEAGVDRVRHFDLEPHLAREIWKAMLAQFEKEQQP